MRVSFFEYPYPLISDPTDWREQRVKIASLDDLACTKLAAIAQRGSRKDFIDMYILATEHLAVGEALELYQSKYGTRDIAHVLVGLSYFDDAEREPSPVMLRDLPWDDVKRQCREWAKMLAG